MAHLSLSILFGSTLGVRCCLIAATALHHHLTLVTRNIADFPDDVDVHNPWSA